MGYENEKKYGSLIDLSLHDDLKSEPFAAFAKNVATPADLMLIPYLAFQDSTSNKLETEEVLFLIPREPARILTAPIHWIDWDQ